MVRHDYRTWKRILQTDAHHRWRPKDMTEAAAYARIYREDERAQEDFSLICNRLQEQRPVETDTVSALEACRNELLLSIMPTGQHYSITQEVSRPGPSGVAVEERVVTHFHLLDTAHQHRRPRAVTTVESADSIPLTAGLAFQVVWEEPWLGPDGPPIEKTATLYSVLSSGHSEWVRPSDIAPNVIWYRRLYKWDAGISPVAGCLLLSGKSRCQNMVPILDPKCPTLAVCWKLIERKWQSAPRRCVHESLAIGPFDSAEAVKMKCYCQCLYALDRVCH